MSSGHPGPGPVSSQPQLYDVSSGQGTNAAHSGYAGTVHVGSLADRLRTAASKGQTDKVKELYLAGARFEPDRVSILPSSSRMASVCRYCVRSTYLLFARNLLMVIF